MRPRIILPGLAACLLAVSPVLASQASAATVPSFGHVFVIVGENKLLSLINSTKCPLHHENPEARERLVHRL